MFNRRDQLIYGISGTLLFAVVATAQSTRLIRETVAPSAVMHSTGGDVVLSATIGQPNGGVMTGGEFTLTSGFWFLPALGDCNLDGGINLYDYGAFPDCMTGPVGGESGPECLCLDLHQDGAIDLHDFARLQRRLSGLE